MRSERERSPPGAMRMAELAMRSGVPRETIHFYLREGLLPRPRKGGRTVAYYDQEHLDRLLTIRRLREEKYLPLAVIRRLLDSPAAEQDVNTLADVLHIVPAAGAEAREPTSAALREALTEACWGPRRGAQGGHASPSDPAERRVLAIVDEALALEPNAQRLTLEDLEACAGALEGLVAKEAELFFDLVFESADIAASIASLRAGRGAVARFITAFRDLMLRRIVEDLLLAVQHGPDVVARVGMVPVSARKEREVGTFERRAQLRADATAEGAGPEAVQRLVWHLFACGAASDLAALPPDRVAAAGPRCGVVAAWGAFESARSAASMAALERAAALTPDFALARILVGEAVLARGVRRPSSDAGFLDRAVPALAELTGADPEADSEVVARALGHFHRGRVELALPSVLGRGHRGAQAMERTLGIIEDTRHEDQFDAAARARIGLNARLALGRHLAGLGETARARVLLEEAREIDPEGPIGDVVREELAARGAGGAQS